MLYGRGPHPGCPPATDCKSATLPDLLRLKALQEPEKLGYTFLTDDEAHARHLTYKELDQRARTIAAALQKLGAKKGRALLLYPPGLDFIAGFFGCLYAGVVAVPAYPPDPARLNRTLPRLQAIVTDAEPTVVLTTSSYSRLAEGSLAGAALLNNLGWLATDALPISADDSQQVQSFESDLAFIQYTSGSTGTPRGVMLTHENLLRNAGLVYSSFEHTAEDKYLSWLPTFHDMGFMAGVLEPLYAGLPVILMSPVSFLQRPLRWLQAISRYKVTVSGGPNFAYDLCVRKITAEERASLDLSSWDVAFNGAEPVRAETLERFQSVFSPCGFRREAFYPCYGLAEATLIVSGGLRALPPVVKPFDAQALERNLALEAPAGGADSKLLVSCGGPLQDQRVIIVDPETCSECPPGWIGEVWISGASVAEGYWKRPEETSDTFKAYLSDMGRGPFLRTGDLGFMSSGELYISGRIKDLIIIRGLNHYPQDIERTVERCHAGLRPGCGAAFSVEAAGEERLVIIQEVETRLHPDTNAVIDSIREAIASEHELQAYAVTLVAPGTIAKTSSGKIQRHACREAFLGGTLERVAEWRASVTPQVQAIGLTDEPRSTEAIESWLAHQLAARLSLDVSEIDFNQPITRYGLDSLTAVELAHLIEVNLGVTFSAGGLLQGPSVVQIACQALTQSTEPSSTFIALAPAVAPATGYPLSEGQRGLWFLQQFAPESAAYNIARVVRIKSRLDALAMRRAFQGVVDRHPCLRTSFIALDGEPVQRVREHVEADFEHCNAERWDDDSLDERLSKDANQPFDLGRSALLRVRLFTRSSEEHILLLVVHHIVSDFWSLAVLSDELVRLYEMEKKGGGAGLPAPVFGYSDYVRWQAAMLSSPLGESLRDYWNERLSGGLPILDLPTDRPRPLVQTFRGASHSFRLDEGLTRRLKSLSRDHDATLFMVLLAAFQSLMYRYTGQEDILVGSPASGRARSEWRSVIGYFINLLVLRARLSADVTFSSLLNQTRRDVLDAIDHQDYPFPRLVEHLRPDRDAGRPPLVQAVFIFQKSHLLNDEGLPLFALAEPGAKMKLGDLDLQSMRLEQRATRFDLTMSAAEVCGEVAAAIEYNTDLFDASTVERMSEHFCALLESAIANPMERVCRLPLLTVPERRRLLIEWNDTRSQYEQELSLHGLFERRAAQTPESTALLSESECVSYRGLNDRANQLAHYLNNLGLGAESLVAISVERGVEMVIGLLGILKAGCAYVPLDPSYPKERLNFMLEDSKASLLLTRERLLEPFSASTVRTICPDRDWDMIQREGTDNPTARIQPDGLAYVIYTSGTTGRPKGVQVSHRAVMNFISSMKRQPGIEPDDVLLAVTSLSFDIAGLEIYLPLTAGARLVLASREEASDGARLANLIADSQVTIMQATPATWQLLLDAGWQGSDRLKILCGGEALSLTLASHLLSTGKELWNLYGPTETTIWSTIFKVESNERLSIGRPINNTRLYLLDSCGEPVPASVTGKLHIGGDGLARGYLNHPDLSAEKFIPDPFSYEPGARLYKTGDLARYLPDGNIEFLGREDHQVKVRGFRVELGEVEAVLNESPELKEAVVMVKGSGAIDQRLIAYVVPAHEQWPPVSRLRDFLKLRLPDYMLPSDIVYLSALPRLPNGKIDRRALPASEGLSPGLGQTCDPPLSHAEETLAMIWAEVLEHDRVGRHDNFFELGGHSLLATRVIARVRAALGIQLPVRIIFEAPTVAEMAEAITKIRRAEQDTIHQPIKRVSRDAELPLSYAQQRLWFLDHFEPGTYAYNMSGLLRLTGPLDLMALGRSLNDIVRRHESLRTIFPASNGKPFQSIASRLDLQIAVTDLRALLEIDREAEALRLANEEAREPFDLARGPLLRAKIFRLGEGEHWLSLTLHHMVSDRWSLGVFVRELSVLYNANREGKPSPLAETLIQYADFACWQRDWLREGVLEKQLSYWRRQLADAPTILQLPTDEPRPQVQSFLAGKESILLSPELFEGLKALSRSEGATLFMTLLAAFNVLLYRYTGQQDIVIGSPVANRSHVETENLIGLFVNTLALRTDLTGSPTFRQLLGRVREAALGAYVHQDMPFEKLVEVLQPSRHTGRNPLFQVIFDFQDAPLPLPELTDLTPEPLELDALTTMFMDMTLEVVDRGKGPKASLEYSKDIFHASTIIRMLESFRVLLESVVAWPDRRVSQLPLLSNAEAHRSVMEWNETRFDFQPEFCLHNLFELQTARTPLATALFFEGQQITYRDLNQRANKLAHHLMRRGVKQGSCVGVCLERSPAMIAAMLAILKAGGAYLPLDPDLPPSRIAFMVADSGADFLLTQDSLLERIPDGRQKTVCLDGEKHLIARQSDGDPYRAMKEGLAYVIYTSGSTGTPKAVLVSHRAASNHMQWMSRAFPLSATDRVLQKYSIGFDASIAEIFYPFVSGAALVIARQGGQYDLDYLIELMARHEVTVIDVVPAMLDALLGHARVRELLCLRQVACGGEALPVQSSGRFYDLLPGVRLINMYGPTEATITATCHSCDAGSNQRSVPIGKPVANTPVCLLDECLQPVPVGAVGEIYIGGEALAWGYLNQPGLTAERFIPDPFCAEGGARLYRSGDLGRYLPGGDVEFIGRADRQVKLRGYRIELGEIEARLMKHAAVKAAAVAIIDDNLEGRRLACYIVLNKDAAATRSELRDWLKKQLPAYMIPASIVMLEEMPLGVSGKIDHKKLPAPDLNRREVEQAYVEPQSETERKLVKIWEEVLSIERVGVKDSFFELGGDSILSIQVVARARESGLEITPKDLFEHQTISELALAVRPPQTVMIWPETSEGLIPLTPIQHWFFEQELPNPDHYNQAVMLEVKQDVDATLLEEAFRALVEHHDALRLRFEQRAGVWEQTCAPRETHDVFKCLHLSGFSKQEKDFQMALASDEAQASLSLSHGPIARAIYFATETESAARLLIVIHHLAVDGVSWRILIEDLASACEQLKQGRNVKLPRRTLSVGQWGRLLADYAQDVSMQQELQYWTADARKLHARLPADYAQGKNTAESSRGLSVNLSDEETRLLIQRVPSAYRTRMNEVLLAALAQTLSEWTGQSRVLVDVEGHGREEIIRGLDLSRTVGWFTTIYPALLEPRSVSDPAQALKSVKEQLRRVPNRGIGYGLLRYLTKDDSAAEQVKRMPQAEVSFNYLGQLDQPFAGQSVFAFASDPVGRARSGSGMRSHAIEVDASVIGGRLSLQWSYSEQLHSPTTIERLARTFIQKLRRMIEHCLVSGIKSHTPSDFALAKLSQQKLEQIGEAAGEIEDIYPLSPMQKGMLFHSLYGAASDVYCTQLTCELRGELNRPAFLAAWQSVADQHQVLRTGFEWEGVEEPLQVVRQKAQLPINEQVWRGLDEARKEEKLARFLKTDRQHQFHLSRPPLMRLTLIDLGQEQNILVWSSHHLLMDGWSLPIILKDVLATYERLTGGAQVQVERRRPYRDFVAWLTKQDITKAEGFWRSLLKDLAPSLLFPREDSVGAAELHGDQEQMEIRFSEEMSAGISTFARRYRLTPGTILEGAWALLLSSYTGQQDVVFGVVMSGRSIEMTGVESMVGLFINTLPVRAQVRPQMSLLALLEELQAQLTEIRQYEQTPLPDVQSWSELPHGAQLFDSIFVFENYPVDASAKEWLKHQEARLSISDIHFYERSNYPLTITAVPGGRLSLKMLYDPRLGDANARALLKGFQVMVEAMLSDPNQAVKDLSSQLAAFIPPNRDGAKDILISSKPAPRKSRPSYVAPRNAIEEAVTRMWSETLGLGRISMHDDFFETGGKRVLASRLLHRVHESFGVELPLSIFLQAPTIAGLSEAIAANDKYPGRVEKIARILNRIERMSADDINKMVQQKEGRDGEHGGDGRLH